jgi:hypothetical protein
MPLAISKKITLLYMGYLRRKKLLRRGDENQMNRLDNHSGKVVKYKKLIVRLIILLVVILSILPFINVSGNAKFNFQTDDKKGQISGELAYDKPVVINPRYNGVDNNNRPFKLSAESGFSEDKINVFLEKVVGELTMKDNTIINLKGEKAAYNINQKQLNLSDGVVITLSNGYVVETKSATVKTDENMATGSDPVTIKGEMGDLFAKGGFIINNSGDQVQFVGGVKMLIKPEQAQTN